MDRSDFGGWFVDLLVGGLGGLVIAWIVAVNLVIYLGVEGGYQAELGDVFGHSVVFGVVVIGVAVAGPVLGVVYMRRQRRQRDRAAVDAGMPGSAAQGKGPKRIRTRQ